MSTWRQELAPEIVRERVRKLADAAHEQYPQYRHHWDGEEWFVVEFKQKVETKMGVAFEKGDLTIARQRSGEFEDREMGDSICAYSVRNRIDTWVEEKLVRVVG